MAFGAVDGEEEDEEDGDMLNSVGDGDGGAQRKVQHKRTITKRTSNMANTTTSAVNGEDDDDVHEKDVIIGGGEGTNDERQQNKSEKMTTITTMFKRFADKNNGAFLFAAS